MKIIFREWKIGLLSSSSFQRIGLVVQHDYSGGIRVRMVILSWSNAVYGNIEFLIQEIICKKFINDQIDRLGVVVGRVRVLIL